MSGVDSCAISCVVPCRNESATIESCLSSILEQQCPADGFEVIVVDGMSDDGTREVLNRMARTYRQLKVVDNPAQITPCAMNVGIRHSRGCYVAIMGAHNRYAPDYLIRSLEVSEQIGADNVGGVMICEPQSWLQRIIAIAHHSRFSVGGARWHDTEYEGPADTVFGGVYRRDVFDRIGYFDEELVRNQDDEFNLRLSRSGGVIWQSPRIKSWYHPRNSLAALFKQQLQYGYWKVRVIQKHRLPASPRHLVPVCFVLALVLLPIAALYSFYAMWLWITVTLSYLSCNLIASLLVASRNRWSDLLALPAVFACYHLAYGLGFLHGLWDFVLRRKGPRSVYTQINRARPQKS